MTTLGTIDLHIDIDELVIDGLVLDGAVRGDRQRIARSIERELGRLIGEQGLPPTLASGETLASLSGGRFAVAPGAQPETIGRQVAQAVYRGMGR